MQGGLWFQLHAARIANSEVWCYVRCWRRFQWKNKLGLSQFTIVTGQNHQCSWDRSNRFGSIALVNLCYVRNSGSALNAQVKVATCASRSFVGRIDVNTAAIAGVFINEGVGLAGMAGWTLGTSQRAGFAVIRGSSGQGVKRD